VVEIQRGVLRGRGVVPVRVWWSDGGVLLSCLFLMMLLVVVDS